MGADFTINYKEVNVPEEFAEKVMEFTDNKGADYILDPIFAQNFNQNLKCLAIGCRWVCYGFLGGANVPEGFSILPLLRKRASLLTSTLRSQSDDFKAELI